MQTRILYGKQKSKSELGREKHNSIIMGEMMIGMKIGHHHQTLTLIKNGHELVCPKCHQNFDESYRCDCNPCPYPYPFKCILCEEKISDSSLYTCEVCWKNKKKCRNSPLVHRSCFELPAEIRIASFRPHCLLVFKKEGSDCHFCKQKKRRYKYVCEDCNFQICCGCVSKLSKYHEGREQVKHFSHRHPLTLLMNLDDAMMNCKLCNEGVDGPAAAAAVYGCAPCKFYIHESCREVFLPEIDHHFHPKHPLAFQNYTLNGKEKNRCDACRYKMEGLGYRCNTCNFNLHPKCTALKANIKYGGHRRHLLVLVENLDYRSKCEACRVDIRGVFYIRCVECSLDFHVRCDPHHPLPATVLYNKEYEYRLEAFAEEDDSQLLSCNICGKERNPKHPFYRCTTKGEYIAHVRCVVTEVQYDELKHFSDEHDDTHNSGGRLLQEIWHPFHPRHSLTLLDDDDSKSVCKACCFYVRDLRYRCDTCDFELHPQCIALKANIEYTGHRHLLILVENTYYRCQCEACGCEIQGIFFLTCVECDLYFHVQCGPLPWPSVVYEKHRHPLTLSTKRLAKVNSSHLCCHACHKAINPKHPIYSCARCGYHAHMRCAITKVPVDGRDKIRHFSHKHLLFLLENKRSNYCVACGKSIQASPAYGCDQCEFYLHKSCVDLPREIQHPFHRHTLSLPNPYSKMSHKCSACGKNHYGFDYSCKACKFSLGLDCSSMFPKIKLHSYHPHAPYHPHTLTFFKKLYENSNCHLGRRCIIGQNKSTPLDNWYLRCVPCNFSLHLLCCPLPTSFKHDCHPPQHSLNLKDNFGDLFVDDFEDEEYCCDFCETRRDARECVYHCEECNFVVDLECLFSEIIQFLEGKRKDAEFTTVSKMITKKIKGLTYNDIVLSLTEEEKKVMQLSIKLEEMINDGTLEDMFDDLKAVNNKVRIRISSQLVDFMNEARENDKGMVQLRYLEEEEDADAELVNVGDYKISPKFRQILTKLLKKSNGDIFASCSFSQSLKTMLLTTLCKVVQEMRDIEVKNIPSEFFISWWILLKLLQRAGLSIDFALDHVKKTADKYFLIKDSSSISSDPLYERYKKISLLSKEVDQRKEEIKTLKNEIKDKVSSHDVWRAEANRIDQALGSWWKNAADGLLDDILES